MSTMNDQRAARAAAALEAYIRARGEVFEHSPYEAADLIADLLHDVERTASEWHVGVDATLKLARLHYEAEASGRENETE